MPVNYNRLETAYTLYSCNIHKERGSMRSVAVAGDMETLYAVIGNEIMEGNMDYRGYSKKKGFALFREDYRNSEFSSANLDYGYIDEQPYLVMGSKAAVQSEWEQTHELLMMDDSEYKKLCEETQLKGIDSDRLRVILDNALHAVANDYRGAELYEYLRDTLGMKDDEISKAGFDLEDFYADHNEYEEACYFDEQENEEDAEL